jgi:YVTN family beta-propeller protein
MARTSWKTATGVGVGLLAALAGYQRPSAAEARFTGPTSSQPLALSADGSVLAVANPDNDNVSFFKMVNGLPVRVGNPVVVGNEPNGVVLMPDGSRAYVANTIDGTISVLTVDTTQNPAARVISPRIKVGTEPYGLALTPNGTKLYVTNARSNTVTVISTSSNAIIKTIRVGPEPRGIAITNDGDGSDTDETVYITQFLSLGIPGKVDGADDAKAGHVTVISASTDAIVGDVTLDPIAVTGFKASGDALQRIPPGTEFTFTTGAYANQLNNIGILGNFAFVPNTGASPNGPVRFNVNTQSLLHVINRATRLDAHKTINMHEAVRDQTNPAKRFNTVPWAIAFKHSAPEGFVISAASNHVIKLDVDPGTGAAEVQFDSSDLTRVLQIPTGRNPRGIVITPDDTRAFVMNYVGRTVTVIDLTTSPERAIASVVSAALPAVGSLNDKIQAGRELYNTSVGTFDAVTPGGPKIVGRMSAAGWGSCSSCHPNGLSDNVVWMFPPGPRRTIPQHGDFSETPPFQRILNWSAERDEEEDFELNIRAVSGGAGLIVLPGTSTQDPNVANFLPLASGDRNQLKVRGFNAWDALEAYVQFGIRAPISPVSATEPDVVAGRALFASANCQSCHGGPLWTSSRLNFTPPPDPASVVNGQLVDQLRNVGTFDPAAFNEVRQNAAPPLGADGFQPGTLLSLFAFPKTFLHNGAESSLGGVLQNVTHRSAGTGGVDTLTNAADREKLVRFLLSIDRKTPVVP